MNKALIWKEWRQHRPLVFTALAVSLLMPLFTAIGSVGGFRTDSLTQVLPALQYVVLLPAFALATGALSFAEDRSERTYGFLMSRPTSYARVWLIKIGVAFAVLVLIAVLTGVVATVSAAAVQGPVESDLSPVLTNRIGGPGVRGFVANAISNAMGPSALSLFVAVVVVNPLLMVLLFGSAVLWSTRLSRPFHAMIAGAVTTIAIVLAQLPLFFALAIGGRYRSEPLAPLFIAAVLVAVSFFTFRVTGPRHV